MHYLLLFLTAIVAGAANAVAGGGTFFTFPALASAGLPILLANATNAAAVSPGHALASFSYWRELARFRQRLVSLGSISALGALTGVHLLAYTSDRLFAHLVPWLILFATLLFACGPRLQSILCEWRPAKQAMSSKATGAIYFLCGIYGGYFGAGFGIMLLAVLTLSGEDDIQTANALKNMIATIVAFVVIGALAWHGLIIWPFAVPMLAGATIGGLYGGRLAHKLRPPVLRGIVIAIGTILTLHYFFF